MARGTLLPYLMLALCASAVRGAPHPHPDAAYPTLPVANEQQHPEVVLNKNETLIPEEPTAEGQQPQKPSQSLEAQMYVPTHSPGGGIQQLQYSIKIPIPVTNGQSPGVISNTGAAQLVVIPSTINVYVVGNSSEGENKSERSKGDVVEEASLAAAIHAAASKAFHALPSLIK
ncbi:hypothetical protein IWQ62_004679 [Dispira parvispora]|uniref:Uncharacterized protein n=1 Tax=Dispira parvispora TaxID=1520584 RepID=A0A9W8ALX6_9FUNG|nr:hypothetical protein IWQ62_004679 [Dispira parvispora]